MELTLFNVDDFADQYGPTGYAIVRPPVQQPPSEAVEEAIVYPEVMNFLPTSTKTKVKSNATKN